MCFQITMAKRRRLTKITMSSTISSSTVDPNNITSESLDSRNMGRDALDTLQQNVSPQVTMESEVDPSAQDEEQAEPIGSAHYQLYILCNTILFVNFFYMK